jgi:hypothetical protein
MKILTNGSDLKGSALEAMRCAKHDIRQNLLKELQISPFDLNPLLTNFWE